MSRSVLLMVALVLAAGCVATPGADVQTASTVAPVPALLKAEGATITAVVGGVILSWTGTVTPARDPDPIGILPIATAQGVEQFSLTMPPEVTLLHGWLNYSGGDVDAIFRMANDSGANLCGGVLPDKGTSECFATLYRERSAGEDWTITVLPSGATQSEAPVDFTLEVLLGTLPLPMLGSPAPFGSAAPLTFDAPVLLSTGEDTHTAEPSIAVTPEGIVYVAAPVGAQRALWRSEDGGKTFTEVAIHGTPTDPGSLYDDGGGDSDVAVSGEDTVYFADQHLAETVSASHDGGKTWFTQPLGSGPIPLTDRQWLVTDGDLTAWLAFNGVNGATVSQTRDGGHTWPLVTSMKEDSCFRGNLARAPDGTLYFAGCNAEGPGVGVSTDGGLTWTWHLVAERAGETNTSFVFPAHLFVIATTDADGNAYVVWSDEAQGSDDKGAPDSPHGLNVWLASSSDQGSSWSKPKKVNQMEGTYVLPWATGGAPGHVAIAYYGTKFVGHPERVLGEWYPIVAVTEDALADEPVFQEAAASDTIVQYGPVCMRGSACGNARNLLDFFQIQSDAEGHVHMAYVDGRAGGNYRWSNIMYVHQLGGFSLGARSVDKDGGVAGGIALPKLLR